MRNNLFSLDGQAATYVRASNAALGELLRQRRSESRERLRARVARGVSEGDLPGNTDAARLARFLSATVQGLSLQARDGATREDLQAIIDIALQAIDREAPVAR